MFVVLGVSSMMAIDLLILATYTLMEGIQGNLVAKRVPNTENLILIEGVRNKNFDYGYKAGLYVLFSSGT